MIANKHKVPKKQWAKWTGRPQAMFNMMWDAIDEDEYWEIAKFSKRIAIRIRWNACWLAAEVERKLGYMI